MNTLLAISLSALLSFLFGLFAAAYGTRLSKAIDARKELLSEMRDWIDKIQDFTNMLYQNVKGASEFAWSNQDRAELGRYRMLSSARWLGGSKVFGSKELFDATQEFVKAGFQFEEMYFLEMHKISRNNPLFQKKLEKFTELNNQFTKQAEYLHAIITQETLKGIPNWLFRK